MKSNFRLSISITVLRYFVDNAIGFQMKCNNMAEDRFIADENSLRKVLHVSNSDMNLITFFVRGQMLSQHSLF